MTINNPDPNQNEPTPLDDLDREVFDLIDETAINMTDEEIDQRLRNTLAVGGYVPNPAQIGRPTDFMDLPITIRVPISRGPTAFKDVDGTWATDDDLRSMRIALCDAFQKAAEELDRARRVVAEAEKRAADVAAGADAYVNTALDRLQDRKAEVEKETRQEAVSIVDAAEAKAARIIAEAEHKAARVVAEAKQQASRLRATAEQSRSVDRQLDLSPLVASMAAARPRLVLITGSLGSGKSVMFEEWVGLLSAADPPLTAAATDDRGTDAPVNIDVSKGTADVLPVKRPRTEVLLIVVDSLDEWSRSVRRAVSLYTEQPAVSTPFWERMLPAYSQCNAWARDQALPIHRYRTSTPAPRSCMYPVAPPSSVLITATTQKSFRTSANGGLYLPRHLGQAKAWFSTCDGSIGRDIPYASGKVWCHEDMRQVITATQLWAAGPDASAWLQVIADLDSCCEHCLAERTVHINRNHSPGLRPE